MDEILQALLRPIKMPEPIKEGAVTIWWERSPIDPRKVRQYVMVDFGLMDCEPEIAADKMIAITETVRKEFGVELPTIARL